MPARSHAQTPSRGERLLPASETMDGSYERRHLRHEIQRRAGNRDIRCRSRRLQRQCAYRSPKQRHRVSGRGQLPEEALHSARQLLPSPKLQNESVELAPRGQLPREEQVGRLFVGAVLRQLGHVVPAVGETVVVSREEADGGLGSDNAVELGGRNGNRPDGAGHERDWGRGRRGS